MVDGYASVAVALHVLAAVVTVTARAQSSPHIVVILADDLGWNDVGFHGSDQIPTPNIDALAYSGVILNSHYTPALCTPSRSAFMTGKYPIHTGMQHLVILETEPWGLPLSERLLPQHLRAAGYRTHAVGKWHLGFFRQEYLPTSRGFDSHYGYYQGFQDYYDHSVKATFLPYDGYDMRRDLTVDWAAAGRYSTDVFTEEAVRLIHEHEADPRAPLFLYLSHLAPHAGTARDPFQAPDEDIAKFAHIQDPERRVYAAMVSRLDQSVGAVVAALRARGMLDNTVIVFMSDNGAPTHGIHSNRGSNYPFRGIKETPWEGGVRTVAAVWSPLIKRRQRVSSQLMHMADWLPTLYSAAGLNTSDLGDIDGVDMWSALVNDGESPRTQFVHNIDDIGDVYAAVRHQDWKYIKGGVHKGLADGWYGESGRAESPTSSSSSGYDEQVLASQVAVSLTGFTVKKMISQKRASHENYTGAGDEWSVLSESTVRRLRRAAMVTCSTQDQRQGEECRPGPGAPPCLFNIKDDPCEQRNLAESHPEVVTQMEDLLFRYHQTMVPANNKPSDPMADPSLWNNTWLPWADPVDVVLVDGGGARLLREAITATVILVAVVLLVAMVLRISSPVTLIFKFPSGEEDPRKRQHNTAHDQAEKTNLTFSQNF